MHEGSLGFLLMIYLMVVIPLHQLPTIQIGLQITWGIKQTFTPNISDNYDEVRLKNHITHDTQNHMGDNKYL